MGQGMGWFSGIDRVYITHGFTGMGILGMYPNLVDPKG